MTAENKNVNRIIELLRQTDKDTVLGAAIHHILDHGTAIEGIEMILDLKYQDEDANEDVRKALGDAYDEIKSLWL